MVLNIKINYTMGFMLFAFTLWGLLDITLKMLLKLKGGKINKMNNEQLLNLFVNGENNIKANNLFIEKGVLYSYGYHFPLCIKNGNEFIINSDKYSRTTSKHKTLLLRELNLKNIVEMPLNDILTLLKIKNTF